MAAVEGFTAETVIHLALTGRPRAGLLILSQEESGALVSKHFSLSETNLFDAWFLIKRPLKKLQCLS